MKAFLFDFGPCLSAEILKVKRTLALGLSFLAPLLVALLTLLIYWQRGSTLGPNGKNVWLMLMQNNLIFWILLILPLFVTLQTALLAQLEHGNKNLKHLFALPVSRGALYAAKQVVAATLIGISSLVLWAAIIVCGLALRTLKPGLGFEAPVPFWPIFECVALAYLASWLIIAIHTWIGMRWPSFVLAMSVGVAVMLIAVILVESDYPLYFPWTLPGGVAMEMLTKGTVARLYLALGCLGGIVTAVLAGLEFTRRDVL
jgi:lantibiotic transport system permease protein